jgi:NitT/TauT family transport system substrate-binding protein
LVEKSIFTFSEFHGHLEAASGSIAPAATSNKKPKSRLVAQHDRNAYFRGSAMTSGRCKSIVGRLSGRRNHMRRDGGGSRMAGQWRHPPETLGGKEMPATRTSRSIFGAIGAMLLAASPLPLAAQELKQVTFVQPSPSAINSYTVFVAIGEGYFADEGLEVKVEALNGSGPVIQAVSAGQAQFGRPGPGPVLQARSRGVDIVFIYNKSVLSNFGIVVPEGSPVQKLEDLKGKVLGIGTADGAEAAFARGVLKELGMTEGTDYETLAVGDGGPATAAFQNNEIAAYAASTADAAILNQRGVKVQDITPDQFRTFFGNGYVAMRDYIDANPDVVTGFGRALVRAQVFAMDDANEDKVLAHLKAGVPQEIEDIDFARALFRAVRAKTVPLDLSNGWGYQNEADWERWHTSLIETGGLEKPLDDLKAAYTNDFVKAWNEGVKQ